MKIEQKLPEIKKNVKLSVYTTFKIGGRASYFFEAKTKNEIIKAVKVAKELKLPFFILGRGSNLLISDKGFEGLVVKIQMSKLKCQNYKIYTEAGVLLSQLINIALKNDLSGLEWATGVPGTVGGVIFGNASWPSNKKNISSVIESVEVLEIKPKLKIKNIKLKDCRFDYRDSIFKHNKNLIILSAFLRLKKENKTKIKKEILEILKKRKEKIPQGFSAGSIFKNPENFSAGELIEKCGLKEKKIGKAQISEKHANFIINLGGAKAKDVLGLISLCKQKVKKKFKIELKEEIQYLGF